MELWDIYDKDRNFTGKVIQRGTPLEKNEYRLTVKLAIFNNDGEMLIQKRQSTKVKYPNLWDFSVAGNSIHGEISEETMERELFEELGIEHDFSNERPMFTIHANHGFSDFYILNFENIDINSLKIQHEEVQSVTWATKQEIYQLIDENKFIPYTKALIDLIFFNKDCRGMVDKNDWHNVVMVI